MALTGINIEEAKASINNVVSSYGDIETALISTSVSNLVAPMSSLWGSPEAVDFFEKYQTSIDSLMSSIGTTFESVVNSMNSAASSLASIGGETWGNVPISIAHDKVDVSAIKKDLNGVVGVDVIIASSTANAAMSTIKIQISRALTEACNAVNASGFVGGGMQESLVSSLKSIETNVEDAFDQLSKDIKEAIAATEETYNQTASNVESAFGGSGS